MRFGYRELKIPTLLRFLGERGKLFPCRDREYTKILVLCTIFKFRYQKLSLLHRYARLKQLYLAFPT
jgi:hypothetical protein